MERNLRMLGIVAATALFAGCATGDYAAPVDGALAAKLENYEKTGKRVACLQMTRITSIRPVTERKFLVEVGLNNFYLNEPNARCAGVLSPATRLQYVVNGGSLCRNEIINVVDNQNGFLTGSCSLGSFEELAPRTAPSAK